MNTSIGLKADKTDLTNNYNTLNSAILLKSNSTDVYNKIDTYSKTEVNQHIANLVDSAPTTLNTLNELAPALGNDKNFSTTVTTSISTKQPLLTIFTGSLPILDTTNNKIRQLFTTSPINSSIYNNSSNQFDQNNGNIMLSLDGSY